jgi:Ulp1 family protease
MRKGDETIFLKDALLFPVNFLITHWSLSVVHPHKKGMNYLDSMNTQPKKGVYQAIVLYLQREYE